MDKMKWLFGMLVMSLLGLMPINAQQKLKFSIASFEQDPFDTSAKNKQYEKVDGSGSRYAIIKVTSNNPDDDLGAYRFNFGNLRSSTEIRDGILWVYVQKNAKLVTISRDGYQTINKYDLHATIEAGKNYVMSLTTSGPVVFTQMVQFKVKPLGAKAIITVKSSKKDAQEEPFGTVDATGAVAKSLEYGVYTYKVLADNYYTTEGRITLKDKSTTHVEEVTLRPNYSDMTLVVDADADIYVNGERKGTRSWTGALKAGNYQVECRQLNHESSSQYIAVTENDNRTITLTPPTPISGTIAVTSNPLGANISIDGKDYGQTPRNIDVVIGRHQVVLTQADYKQEQQTVDVVENQTSNVNLTLSRISKMTIDSNPSGASLSIDGKYVGQTPHVAEFGSGDYLVKLVKNKYNTFEKRVHLDSSNPTVRFPLSYQYIKKSNLYFEACLQTGMANAGGVTIGGYIRNINIELGGMWHLGDIDLTGSVDFRNYAHTNSYGVKLGYGTIVGSRIRITPQLGVGMLQISGDDTYLCSEDTYMSFGLRMEYVFSKNCGISVTPEYLFAIKKDEDAQKAESFIKKKLNSFNIKLGFFLCI